MIKVVQQGDQAAVVRDVVRSINYSPAIVSASAVCDAVTVGAGATVQAGGLAIDRSVFRKKLPDAKWYAYAAGVCDPLDGNNLTLTLEYQKDDGTFVSLGGLAAFSGAGIVKKSMGPFDVFATAGVPTTESIPVIRLQAVKAGGGLGATLWAWVIWLELMAPSV